MIKTTQGKKIRPVKVGELCAEEKEWIKKLRTEFAAQSGYDVRDVKAIPFWLDDKLEVEYQKRNSWYRNTKVGRLVSRRYSGYRSITTSAGKITVNPFPIPL